MMVRTLVLAAAVGMSADAALAAPMFQPVVDGLGPFTLAYNLVRVDSPAAPGGSVLVSEGTPYSGSAPRHPWPFSSNLNRSYDDAGMGLTARGTAAADFSITSNTVQMNSSGSLLGVRGAYTGSSFGGTSATNGRLQVTLTEQTMVRIEASASAQQFLNGQPVDVNYVRFVQASGVSSISDFNVGYGVSGAPTSTNVGLSFDQTILLNPGNYHILMVRNIQVTTPEISGFDLSSQISMRWTIVPAPSTAALLGVTGVLGARRRRA